MVKVSDIAKDANLSLASVYSVLRNQYYGKNGQSIGTGISGETRERILKSCRRLGYRPKNREVFLSVYPELGGYAFLIDREKSSTVSNVYFSLFFEGVAKAIEDRDKSLFFSHFDESLDYLQNEEALPRPIQGYEVNKIVITGKQNYSLLLALKRRGCFVVSLSQKIDLEGIVSIVPDFSGASLAAVRYLLENGHRRIGIVADAYFEPAAYNTKRLLAGCHKAMKEARLPFDEKDVFTVRHGKEGDSDLLEFLKQKPSVRPTALFCLDDHTAVRVFETASLLGLTIPKDLSVIGCNDDMAARMIRPKLTTIQFPNRDMGTRAIELLDQGAEKWDHTSSCEVFPIRLQARDSVAPASNLAAR